MSWVAIGASIIGAGLSAGVAAASAPDLVSPAKSSRKAVLASLKALPAQRKVEAAARLGQKVEYQADNWMGPREAYEAGLITKDEWQYYKTWPNQGENQDQRKGRHGVRMSGGHMQINIGSRTADFTGYGDADIQGKLGRAAAQTGLDLQKKYGADFVAEALKQQEMADPEGTAARKLLAKTINDEEAARQTRTRPVAASLDASVMGDVNLGSDIGAGGRGTIDRVLARRGETGANGGAIADSMAHGLEGEERIRQRLQRGMGYLGSGQSPQDAAFRDEQQSMANMASFLGGRTPQSQFGAMAGAQAGAAPMPQSGALPGVDPNLMSNGNAAGLQSYTAGVRGLSQNVRPWFMGLNALVSAANIAGAAGYKPLAGK